MLCTQKATTKQTFVKNGNLVLEVGLKWSHILNVIIMIQQINGFTSWQIKAKVWTKCVFYVKLLIFLCVRVNYPYQYYAILSSRCPIKNSVFGFILCTWDFVIKCQWFYLFQFQGREVRHNASQRVIISNNRLVLQKVTRHTAGNYTCSATNSQGSSQSNLLSLRVKCKFLYFIYAFFLSSK